MAGPEVTRRGFLGKALAVAGATAAASVLGASTNKKLVEKCIQQMPDVDLACCSCVAAMHSPGFSVDSKITELWSRELYKEVQQNSFFHKFLTER